MIPVISCPPRFRRLQLCAGLVVAASVSLCVSVCAYAADLPVEVSGGVFVEVTPDGQLKFSTESDNPIPLRDGRFAIEQNGHWSLGRLPRDNPTEVSPIDFAVSWKQYLNHRVLIKPVTAYAATADYVRVQLPGRSVRAAPAEDTADTLKHLILNCSGYSPKEAGCTVAVSGVVEVAEYENAPRLVDTLFVLHKPGQAAVTAKGKK